jgi:DNA-binding SARP family transcriptional activator
MDGTVTRASLDAPVYAQVFDGLAAAVVVVDNAGAVLTYNPAAREVFGAMLDGPSVRCCDLVACGRGDGARALAYHCITAAVLERGRPLRGLGAALPDGRRADVSVAPLGGGAGAVLEIDAGDEPATRSAPLAPLRITTLGPLALDCGGTDLGGDWLHQRPGDLLRYLICARGHRVPGEELVDALWPRSAGAAVSLRQAVHSLRDRLEPNRSGQTPSRYVLARAGGYELDSEHVFVDADAFEREAHSALLAADRAGRRNAHAQLASAARLYGGEFLQDDPFTECALAERDRLRSLAMSVLRELAESHLEAGELAAASSALQRLTDVDPLELGNQRDVIVLMLRTGQHAAAARRYELVRRQFKRVFGEEPDFSLRDLVRATAARYAPSTAAIRSTISSPR